MQSNKQQKKKAPKPTVPLMELLAYNATKPARLLLKKYGEEDATSYEDLKGKLDRLYKNQPDKITIEKELAEIHPHKDFILKYLCPPPPVTKVIVNEKLSSAEGIKVAEEKKLTLTPDDKFLIAAISIVGIVGLVIYTKK